MIAARSFADFRKTGTRMVRTCAAPLLVAMAVAMVGSAVVHADDHPAAPDFTKRLYLNGGIGLTRIEPESPSDALRVSDNSDTGGHLGIGYDLNRFISIEGYIADLGTSDIEFLGAAAGTVDYQVFGLSALGYLFNSQSGFGLVDSDTNGLFRREGLSLFGRVGIGHMRNDAERVEYFRDHPTHAAFGLGLEYGFRNGFALRTELMSMDTDAKYLNVGVLKRFGDVRVPAAVVPVAPKVEPKTPVAPPVAPVEPIEPVVPPFVYFEFDRSELTDEAQQKLDNFAAAMAEREEPFVIDGHTDWIAPEQYNMSLSVRRAEAVANYLVSKGIDRQRITTMGYGESRPISNNNTANGRALNRRAEIQIR